jgi:hypothetical protein
MQGFRLDGAHHCALIIGDTVSSMRSIALQLLQISTIAFISVLPTPLLLVDCSKKRFTSANDNDYY